MKLIISVILPLTVAMLVTGGCAKEEKSRWRNKNREALYQRGDLPAVASGPDDKGQPAPVAEAPRAGTSWGGNLGPY